MIDQQPIVGEPVRHHRLAVAFEEALRSARADQAWYERNPEFLERWSDLYAEHRIRLALLEKIAEAAK